MVSRIVGRSSRFKVRTHREHVLTEWKNELNSHSSSKSCTVMDRCLEFKRSSLLSGVRRCTAASLALLAVRSAGDLLHILQVLAC
jgi:hypothetical protein